MGSGVARCCALDSKSSVERGAASHTNTHTSQLSCILIEAVTRTPEYRLVPQSLPMSLKKEVSWETSMYTDAMRVIQGCASVVLMDGGSFMKRLESDGLKYEFESC